METFTAKNSPAGIHDSQLEITHIRIDIQSSTRKGDNVIECMAIELLCFAGHEDVQDLARRHWFLDEIP